MKSIEELAKENIKTAFKLSVKSQQDFYRKNADKWIFIRTV